MRPISTSDADMVERLIVRAYRPKRNPQKHWVFGSVRNVRNGLSRTSVRGSLYKESFGLRTLGREGVCYMDHDVVERHAQTPLGLSHWRRLAGTSLEERNVPLDADCNEGCGASSIKLRAYPSGRFAQSQMGNPSLYT
jgi:hypothetical protein